MSRARALVLAAVPALLLLLPACAQEVGLIDRTQSGLIEKSVFEGEWFLRRTVIDAPYDTGYTFIGEQDEVSRISWEVQKDLLIAWRAHPLVEGTPDAAPVAVFGVKEHVDVLREYNVATGEQSNVLSENTTDRMWFERDYVRVDWSKNLATNFSFYVESLEQDPIAYYVEDPSDPDHLVLGVQQDDGSWVDHSQWRDILEIEDAHYLDVVTRVFIKPETLLFEDWWGGSWYEPACWYYGNVDCAPGVVSVRNSFLRVDAALSDYEPMDFPDNRIARDAEGDPIRVRWNESGDLVREEPVDVALRAGDGASGASPDRGPADPYADDTDAVRLPLFDKFGYFRTERFSYDPLYGEVESDRIYLINRWNIWEASHDESGAPIPYAERTIRPIVYHLSPDFPEHLKGAAQVVADQWNVAFRDTVATLTGDPDPPDVFVVAENSRAVDAETGELLHRGEAIGDLRYNHLWLVHQPTRVGLLGYGPSATDPLTGEIFAADAFVYGAAITEWAAYGRDVIDLLNGRLLPEDLALGENVKSYLSQLAQGGKQAKSRSIDEVRDFAKSHRGAAPPSAAMGAAKKPGPGAAAKKPGIEKLKRPAGWSGARLSTVTDTAVEELLMSSPALLDMKGLGFVDPAGGIGGLPPALKTKLSPVHWASTSHRHDTLERFREFSSRNIMMAAFVDDAVAGLALQLKDAEPEHVLEALETAIFKSTSEHEVGHTLGLRHNFEATSDALNFDDTYWELRGEDPQPLASLTQPQLEGRIQEHQYSSIMDYHGRFNTDTTGLGRYDYAAIKFGYGQLVEVFDQAPAEPLLDLLDYGDGTYDRPFDLDEVLRSWRHYTKIPSMLGGTAGITARSDVPYTRETAALMGVPDADSLEAQLTGDAPWTRWEVPYRFCSDEYVFGTPTCNAYDLGADSYEMVRDTVERYENYYWFNNFKRDRVFFDEWDYMDSIYWRYFAFLKITYDQWVFGQWFDADTWEYLRDDAATWAVDDVPWEEAVDGGLPLTAAAMDGLALLQRVLATPAPGAYWYDFSEGYWWSLGSSPMELCGEDLWSWDADYWCADTNVGLGDGRWFESIYDVESGYYFYERLKWIGTFYDKILALETLTSPDTYFLGIDTSASVDQWALSMYLAFPQEIQQILGGIASDRFDLFAGSVDWDGAYLPPDPFASDADKELFAERGPVDPYTSFTVQLYALWYGMAWLNANYDNTFNDSAKIWLAGSGEAIDVVDPSLLVEFHDPFNNRTYVASRLSADSEVIGIGATMLQQAQGYLAAYEAAAAVDGADPGQLDYLKWRVTSLIESVEVVRGLYDLYGYLYF